MSRRDPELEEEALAWIEETIGETIPDGFEDGLKDGKALCKLINTIKPGSVKKVNKMKAPFMCMENISNYLKAIRTVGMNEFEMFGTADLYESKDLLAVARSLHALGRTIQTTLPDYAGPKLGIKVVQKNERHFTEKQLNEARNAVNVFNLGSSKQGLKATQTALGVEETPAEDDTAAGDDAAAGPSAAAAPAPAAAAAAASNGGSSTSATAEKEEAPSTTESNGTAKADDDKPGDDKAEDEESPWQELTTDDGQVYYYNKETGESQWSDPRAAKKEEASTDESSVWQEMTTDSGQVYYYNSETGESQWDDPRPSAGASADAGDDAGGDAGGDGDSPVWQELTTDDGRSYYYNSTTGETQWDRPDDM